MDELEDTIERLKASAAAADAELAGSAASLAEMRRLEAANHALQQRVSQLQGQARVSSLTLFLTCVEPHPDPCPVVLPSSYFMTSANLGHTIQRLSS